MINELSIIIPTLNEEKYLPKLLHSISLQDFQGKMEVIIVDGNSEDRTIQAAEKFKNKLPDLTILALNKRGIGLQRNKGAQKAKYKYLLFIDADMVLPRHFLTRFTKKTKLNDHFIESTTIWVSEPDILSNIIFIIMYPWVLAALLRDKITPGFMLLTTKENHRKIQGFREDLTIAEDVDYGWRSIAAGATYHFHMFPYAFFSVRRLQKGGRIKFYYKYFLGYMAVKRHGVEAVGNTIEYPYGHFGK